MNAKLLAETLFGTQNVQPIEYWLEKYPARSLPAGAEVTRIAPSPTGFLHLGALYMGVINRRIADDTKGVFFLRIEDTDTDREVAGARALIVKGLGEFGIKFDEGFVDGENQFGEYGPYLQTQRSEIYTSFAREMVLRGRAYPCFMTKEEGDALRKEQESQKVRPGYYGKYAVWRDAPIEKIQEKLDQGASYVLRMKSMGDQNKKRPFRDEFLGSSDVPENDEDFVLLKANGIPTYHFAHIVDDYLMGTTFVIRATEWLPSLGKHLELWDALNLPVPKYGHLAPINKKEGSTVRKLSKRKDPEADIMRYIQLGYPTDALIGYLYRLANPSFDEWYAANPRASVWSFPLSLVELQKNGPGPLIDLMKLDDISSNIIAGMSAEDVANRMMAWAKQFDPGFAEVIGRDRQYLERILSIERDAENPRKDIVTWSLGKDMVAYFFDELFDSNQVHLALQEAQLQETVSGISSRMLQSFSADWVYTSESLDEWLSNVKQVASSLGFAIEKSDYKANPSSFVGEFSTFMKIVRLMTTGRNRTPNLFYVLKVMGKDRVLKRLQQSAGT